MSKVILLATVSCVSFCLSDTSARAQTCWTECTFAPIRDATLLYDQNNNYAGQYISSQNYTSGTFSSYNNQAADDFVVPNGSTWRILEVDVSGTYFNGSGPAASETVIFYKNYRGAPGRVIGTFSNLNGSTDAGNFSISMPGKGIRLRSGKYWVSVIVNMNYQAYGQWGWNVNALQNGKQAMWQNPGGGFGYCSTWCTIESLGFSGPDLMFALKGRILSSPSHFR